MAVHLTGDDFYKLPKHVQEQLRREGLAPDSDELSEEEQKQLDQEHKAEIRESAKRLRMAADARYESLVVRTPLPYPEAAEPPPARAHGPPKWWHYARWLVPWILSVVTMILALTAPAELAVVTGALAVASVLALSTRMKVR